MNYWWVNLGDSYSFVLENGFLWAPKKDRGNNTPSHWKTMYDVKEGDVVFAYANGFLRAYATVSQSAYDYLNPFEDKALNEWEKEGNRIDLHYKIINNPIPKQAFNREFFSIQEPNNSPFNKSYNVNQGYLYKINDLSSKLLFKMINKTNRINLNLNRRINEIKDPNSVISALKEYDVLGKTSFLSKYKFKESTSYFLYFNNKLYDSKAIVGVAYKYEYPTEEYLHSEEFSGGKSTVVKLLKELDFHIIEKSITTAAYLALKELNRESTLEEIKETILTNKLYDFGAQDITDVIRNQIERYCDNVSRKQKHNNKLFHKNKTSLYSLLEFDKYADYDENEINDVTNSLESSSEGTMKKVYTSVYERDPKLRKEALRRHGLTCFACGFNFEQVYGEYAKGYIHIHHTQPLFENEGKKRKGIVEDLVPVCANCHSVIHRRRNETKSINEIKEMILKQQARQI